MCDKATLENGRMSEYVPHSCKTQEKLLIIMPMH